MVDEPTDERGRYPPQTMLSCEPHAASSTTDPLDYIADAAVLGLHFDVHVSVDVNR